MSFGKVSLDFTEIEVALLVHFTKNYVKSDLFESYFLYR